MSKILSPIMIRVIENSGCLVFAHFLKASSSHFDEQSNSILSRPCPFKETPPRGESCTPSILLPSLWFCCTFWHIPHQRIHVSCLRGSRRDMSMWKLITSERTCQASPLCWLAPCRTLSQLSESVAWSACVGVYHVPIIIAWLYFFIFTKDVVYWWQGHRLNTNDCDIKWYPHGPDAPLHKTRDYVNSV